LNVSGFLADGSGAQEFGTQFLGLLLVDRASHQAADDSEEAEGQGQSFHIEDLLLMILRRQR
jgi:hypothetical protein